MLNLKRRPFSCWTAILALAAVLTTTAVLPGCREKSAAEKYPEKPVVLRVPFKAGGPSDTDARVFAKHAEKVLGKPIVVQNVPGAGGVVCWNELPNLPKDGYTLTLFNLPHIISQPMVVPDARFKLEDFDPIIQLTEDPTVLAVRKDSPLKSFADLLDATKKSPGRLTVGVAGQYLAHDLVVLMLEDQAQIDLSIVPFEGSAESIKALLGGQIDILSDTLSDCVRLGDKISVLAVAADKRTSYFPDAPTLKELGFNISLSSDRGIAAPKGTPPEIVTKLVKLFRQAAEKQEFKDEAAQSGMVLNVLGPEEVKAKWAKMEKEIRDLLVKLGKIKG